MEATAHAQSSARGKLRTGKGNGKQPSAARLKKITGIPQRVSVMSRCCPIVLRHPDSWAYLKKPMVLPKHHGAAAEWQAFQAKKAAERLAIADSERAIEPPAVRPTVMEQTKLQVVPRPAVRTTGTVVSRSVGLPRRAELLRRLSLLPDNTLEQLLRDAVMDSQFPPATSADDHQPGPTVPALRRTRPVEHELPPPAAAAPKRRRTCVPASQKGILLGFCGADHDAGVLLSPEGQLWAVNPASTREVRKKAVEWCEREIERQSVAIAASRSSSWDTYEPVNFEPVRKHALTQMDATQRTSTAVPALVSPRYVYKFVPTKGKWVDGDGNPRNPFPDMLFTERGVSVLCTMVRSESRVRQRKVVKKDGQSNGRMKVNLTTRRGQQALSSYHEWRHVVTTPLADESGMPMAARTVRARLASLHASPYQVRVSPVLVGAKALMHYAENTHDITRAQGLLRNSGKDAATALEFLTARTVSSNLYASTAGTFVLPEAVPVQDAASHRRDTIVGNDL